MDQANSANPYAAPEAYSRTRRRKRVEHWPLKYLFVATVIIAILGQIAFFFGPRFAEASSALVTWTMVMRLVTYVVWVYLTWAEIPPPFRAGTAPWVALMWMVFPPIGIFYCVTWNARLAKALQMLLSDFRTTVTAPSTLGKIASLFPIVGVALSILVRLADGPYMVVLSATVHIAPLLYCVWMFRVDRCLAEIASRQAARDRKKARKRAAA